MLAQALQAGGQAVGQGLSAFGKSKPVAPFKKSGYGLGNYPQQHERNFDLFSDYVNRFGNSPQEEVQYDQNGVPIGFNAHLNQQQLSAIDNLGNPNFEAGLQPYLNSYHKNITQDVFNNIDKYSQGNEGNIRSRNAQYGSVANDATLGAQLHQNDLNGQNMKNQYQNQSNLEAYNNAITNQGLHAERQFGAGAHLQAQQQRDFDISNPIAKARYNQDFLRATMLGELFGYLPQTGSEYVQQPNKPGVAQRIGGIISSASNPNAQGDSVVSNVVRQFQPPQTSSPSILPPQQQSNFNTFRQPPNFNFKPQFGR